MANELNLPLDPSRTGLTVTAVLVLNNAAVGSPISCPESGTLPGHYSGDMPAVPAGVYGVRFLSAGAQVGTGVIDWDGAKERGIGDLPTVAQVEARTLPSDDYFVVSDYTAPPTPATIWGYSGRTLDGTQATQIASIGSDTPGTVTLVSRLTSSRAGYLDKLNVTGTLANSDDAATYRADVSGLLTSAAYTPPPTTAAIWSYEGRTLDGAQATALVTIDSSINALVALAQADEVISPTQYRKLAAGTNTAILTKTVTNDGAGNIQLRAAP